METNRKGKEKENQGVSSNKLVEVVQSDRGRSIEALNGTASPGENKKRSEKKNGRGPRGTASSRGREQACSYSSDGGRDVEGVLKPPQGKHVSMGGFGRRRTKCGDHSFKKMRLTNGGKLPAGEVMNRGGGWVSSEGRTWQN